MKLGVIGLGLLGRALAARLLRAGYFVHGFDISGPARDAAAALGVNVCCTAADVAQQAELIFLSLPDDAARHALLWGPQQLAAACERGVVILDTTTGAPEAVLRDHEHLAERGVLFHEVCVLGSSAQAEAGEALLLVGAEETSSYSEVLRALSSRVFYFGGVGQGSRMKLLANLVLGLNRLVLAEALALADKAGMEGGQVLEVLKQGPAYARVMDTKGKKMLLRDYAPVARLAQHAKDVGLILDLARSCGARTPLTELHAQLLLQARDLGYAEADNSAIIESFR